jgi:hypothetical protein
MGQNRSHMIMRVFVIRYIYEHRPIIGIRILPCPTSCAIVPICYKQNNYHVFEFLTMQKYTQGQFFPMEI